MIEVATILFGAAFTLLVCLTLGVAVLRWSRAPLHREEELPLALVTGASLLNLLVFALGLLDAWRVWALVATGVVILAWGAWRGLYRLPAQRFAPLPRLWRWLSGVIFAIFGVLYFCYALAPEMSPDGSSYHLGLVARYLRNHGWERITTHLYANLSQGVEMVYLFAFSLGRHPAAALVHLAFLIALAAAMISYARRFGFPRAGVVAALFVFVSPVVGLDGSTAYIDVAVAMILFAVIYLARLWAMEGNDRLLVPLGLAAGYTYAAKYTAAVGLVFAFFFVIWKLRRARRPAWRPLLLFSVCAGLMVAPWMLRNWIWLENPVSPFFNRLFPNPYTHISFEQSYSYQQRHYAGLASYWDIPVETTVRGAALCGLLGPLFLLAPLGLIALRWREGRWLWLGALVAGAAYPLNIGTRFLIPPLPFVSLAMAMVFVRVPGLAPALVLAHALLSWPAVIPKYASPYAWRIDGLRWRAALRLESEDGYLRRKFPGYRVARMVEEKTPPGARVLTFGQIPEAYTTRETLVVYQGAWNEVLGDMLWTPISNIAHPIRHIRFEFPASSFRAVRLRQTATGLPEQWSVSEMRVFHAGAELPRAPIWRLSARPNPWDVQRAFDNSPVTRWRSWEPIYDGMWIAIDFGETRTLDAVALLCTADEWDIKLRLEGSRDGRHWEPIPATVTDINTAPPPGMRRMVAAELKRAGVDYLLTHPNDFGREDFVKRRRAWGVTLLGEEAGVRLYRFDGKESRQ